MIPINLPSKLPDEELLVLLNNISKLEVREIIIKRNLRLVMYIAREFENTKISIEDLFSIGTFGLIKAVDTFDINKNVKFVTYARRCIENEILMYLRINQKYKNILSFDEVICSDYEGNTLLLGDILFDDKSNNAMDAVESREMLDSVLTFMMNELSYKELLVMLYVLSGRTQQEVGNLLGISQSYVSRIQKQVPKKLRRQNFKKVDNTLVKSFIFSVLEDENCYIGFSKVDFKNFKENYIQFLTNNKTALLFLSNYKIEEYDDYFMVKMPLIEETFFYIAEIMVYLRKISV